jgi:hypothetical protein
MILFPLSLSAQVQVESSIDSIQILIGEQAHLSLDVSLKKGQSVQLPMFKPSEYITPGVEVLEMSDADTMQLDNGMIKVSRVYTLTSFDEQLYYLPPMKVKVGGKDYLSKSLALKVLTVPVDTLHPENFFPPKDVQDSGLLKDYINLTIPREESPFETIYIKDACRDLKKMKTQQCI